MTAKLTKRASDGMWLFLYTGPDAEGVERVQRISTGTRDQAEANRLLVEFNALRHPKHPIVQRMAALQAQANGETAPVPQAPAALAAVSPKIVTEANFTLQQALDKALDDPEVWKSDGDKNIRSDIKQLGQMIVPPSTVPLTQELLKSFNHRRLKQVADWLKTAPRPSGRAKGKPYGDETARKLLNRITRVCRAAHTQWVDDNGNELLAHIPMLPSMPKGQQRTRVVQPFEEDMILEAIKYHRDHGKPGGDWWAFGHLIAWCILAGTRIGETVYIGPDAVRQKIDPETDEPFYSVTIDPRWTKGGKGGRTIRVDPLFAPFVPALNARAQPYDLKKIVDRKWFYSKQVLRWFPMTAGKAWQMWDIMRDWVKQKHGHDLGKGGDGLTLHNLRHTCATRLIEADVGLIDVQNRLGHRDIKITQRYIHADATSERRIIARTSKVKLTSTDLSQVL